MRILFLTKYDLARGGVAEVLRALGAALAPLGVEVCCYSDAAGETQEAAGGDLASVRGPLPRPGGLAQGRAVGRIERLCADWRIDLIHAHGLYRSGYAARRLWRRTGLPYVVTSHGDIVESSSRMRRRSVRRRCRAILRDAAAVTHLSVAMARRANELLDVSAKSRIIPNGVDLAWWRRSVEPVGGEGEYVLALGRLVGQKNFAVLIEALKRLTRRGGAVSLVIAGRGPQAEPLKAQARRLGLAVLNDPAKLPPGGGAVCFPGFVADQPKRALFAGCGAVAFPSRTSEGFGVVLAEAMAAGKAIVAGDIESTREIVSDGRNGLLVGPDDPGAWAKAIERLLSDEALRRGFEQANARQALRYDWSDIAAEYAAVYRHVLSGE